MVDDIQYENENLGNEARLQNRMLDQVNDEIDETSKNMYELNTKLKKLFAKTSTCCLWIIIFLELVPMIYFAIDYYTDEEKD